MDTQIRLTALCIVFTLSACASTADRTSVGNSLQAKDSTCLNSTGSRIPAADNSCTGVGRSYSREDLDRTGATSAAGALQLLDPSIASRR